MKQDRYEKAKLALIREFYKNEIVPRGGQLNEREVADALSAWLKTRWRTAKDRYEHYWLTEGTFALGHEIMQGVRCLIFKQTRKPVLPETVW
jgi:hypothetical protein